jgi:Phosphotransferase enzyme family
VHAVGAELVWLTERLWGQPGSFATLGDPPAGARVTERYVVVPSARRPRYLLPEDRRASWAALTAGRATRAPRTARRRTLAGAAIRGGVGGAVWRDRLTVSVSPGHDRSFREEIAEALGVPVRMAISVRPATPFRTPVVTAVGADVVVAYAKVATDVLTATNVRTEAAVLSGLAGDGGDLRVPRVLAELGWRGHPVLLTEPMPSDLRRYDPRTGAPPAELTARVATAGEHGTAPLASGPVAGELRRRLGAAGGALPELAAGLGDLLSGLEAVGERPLAHGLWHGDWSPWNMAWRGSELWVWDWEFARSHVPLGLDLPHFHFQQFFIAEGRGLEAALERAHRAAAPALAALGHDDDARPLVRAAHAAEVALRALEAAALGVAPNPRVTNEGPDALRAERARLGA